MKKIILMILPFFLASCEFEAEDTTAPEIKLLGSAEESVDMNEASRITIDELLDVSSATVTDNLDNDISINSTTAYDKDDNEVSEISIKIPGEYKIVYYSEDASGNKSTAERKLFVKDMSAPQIIVEKLHDVSKYGPLPSNADDYSIKIPRGTEVDEDDILHGVTMKDVWSINNGIESENPTKPTLSYEIISAPRIINDKVVSFDIAGEYLIKYKAIDDAKNESTFNRSVFVSDDIERPIRTCSILEIDPLEDQNALDDGGDSQEGSPEGGEDAADEEPTISEVDKKEFLKKVAIKGCEVSDGFYPYNRFSSNLELGESIDPESDTYEEEKNRVSRHIVVTVLEDHPAYIKNITPESLTRPTGVNGILVPISITDESNGYDANKITFRIVVIKDVTPPTLARDIPSGILDLELDASLTAAEIKAKIVELSSDKNNLDDFVEFLDKENKDIPLYVESIKDANGAEVLNTDNSLDYNSLIGLSGPLTVLYTTNDGLDCPEDNLLCGNSPDSPAELRTRSLELVDTKNPEVRLPNFEGLNAEPFFSFVQSSTTEYIEARKQDLLTSGDLQLVDNSTQNPNDILFNAKVISTTNTTCQDITKELDFSCDGVHTVKLTATDLISHVGEYEKEVTIYIYDQGSKDSFDEILTKTTDGNGNDIYQFNAGVNYGVGNYDLGNMVSEIEAISKDSSFDPMAIPEMYFYQIPSTNSFTNSQGDAYNLNIEYKSIDSNFFRYYIDLDGKEKISFNRPQNKEKYLDPLDGLEKVPNDRIYNSLVKFRVTVGNYSELVSVLLKSVPYIPLSSVKNVIIPVYPKYKVQGDKFFYRVDEKEEISREEDEGSYKTEFISKTFYDDNISAVRDFLDVNTSGIYPFEPGIYTPNNGVNRPGVGILIVDNLETADRYKENSQEVIVPDYIVDNTGQLKPKYHKILADYLKGDEVDWDGLIETSDGFKSILNNDVSDPIKLSELNIFFIIIDGDLKIDENAFMVKPYNSPFVYNPDEPDFGQGNKYHFDRYASAEAIVAEHKCLEDGVYVNAPRSFIEMKPLCKVDGKIYYNENLILEDPVAVETHEVGDISAIPSAGPVDTWIWSVKEKITPDPDGGPDTVEEISGWCPTTNNQCEPAESDTREILIEYDLLSDLYYNKQEKQESELSSAIMVASQVKEYEKGVIRHLVAPSVGSITTGDFLSRLSMDGLIFPLNENINKIKNYPMEANASVEIDAAIDNYYTMPRETEMSFLSSGFLSRKDQNSRHGSNPHNLSAYDKERIASIQPIQLSYNDMKDNKKVYEYNLNSQSKDNNSTVLKVMISEKEYFMIEKRRNSGYDSTDALKVKFREELEDGSISESISEEEWMPDASGVLVWHVEHENNGATVDIESGISGIFGPNFKLIPGDESSSATTNTNDNSGQRTGIVINIDKNLKVKVCHESVGADELQSYYDINCDIGK